MKKIILSLLFVVCLFALMFELTGNDPNNNWSFRTYVSYVTENIEPFPQATILADMSAFSNFWDWLGSFLVYPFRCVFVVLKNIGVLLYGLFPVNVGVNDKGETLYPAPTPSWGLPTVWKLIFGAIGGAR